jgi:hypothetical protein
MSVRKRRQPIGLRAAPRIDTATHATECHGFTTHYTRLANFFLFPT